MKPCRLATSLSSPRGGRITCLAPSGQALLGNPDISSPLGFGARVPDLVLVFLRPVLDEFSYILDQVSPTTRVQLSEAGLI